METDVTPAEALAIIAEHGAYGKVRIYGLSDEYPGQILSIKSKYHLDQYSFTRIYAKTNNGMPPIRRA